ncbi:hypothetical protein BDK51DRAFT_28058 [Blyttiomyces helicus]|uniref:Uncharacterized protein n=1 Tax=Blyttiomyces helicus TaxID=388810 RepID=A0A4P9W7K4_9FUNG|nr:hypothetical protein BDK51DRAFT_28058 [Blyttiomyces helicus]|eukprot:RKO87018.1 hypothetical protein BDK51DRAFT_28058 [Blyttiomyces helicus]
MAGQDGWSGDTGREPEILVSRPGGEPKARAADLGPSSSFASGADNQIGKGKIDKGSGDMGDLIEQKQQRGHHFKQTKQPPPHPDPQSFDPAETSTCSRLDANALQRHGHGPDRKRHKTSKTLSSIPTQRGIQSSFAIRKPEATKTHLGANLKFAGACPIQRVRAPHEGLKEVAPIIQEQAVGQALREDIEEADGDVAVKIRKPLSEVAASVFNTDCVGAPVLKTVSCKVLEDLEAFAGTDVPWLAIFDLSKDPRLRREGRRRAES